MAKLKKLKRAKGGNSNNRGNRRIIVHNNACISLRCRKDSSRSSPLSETAFVDCKTFGRWAESLAKHKKGDMALVSGRLKTDSWEKDGRKQSKLIVICDSVRFFVPQNGSSASASVAENESAMREELNDKNGKPPF